MPGQRVERAKWDDARPLRTHTQHGPEAPAGPLRAPPPREALRRGLHLFGNRICPFAHRAWWTALEKGLPLEYHHVDFTLGPKGKPSWYVAEVNPVATIPVLYDGGEPHAAAKGAFAADAPTEHLNRAYAARRPALLDGLPAPRLAAVRRFVAAADASGLVPLCYALLGNQDPGRDAALARRLHAAVRAVGELLPAAGGGPYLLGDALSAGDVAIAPFLDRFEATLPHWRGVPLFPPATGGGGDPARRVEALLAACRSRPAFRTTSQTPAFYVDAYEVYVGARGRSSPNGGAATKL